MLAQRIKTDLGLTDSQLGFLAGPASIICYMFIGIPLVRLADIFPRKYVLAGGVTVIGVITALGGIAQTFTQFVGTRVPRRGRLGARPVFLFATCRRLSAAQAHAPGASGYAVLPLRLAGADDRGSASCFLSNTWSQVVSSIAAVNLARPVFPGCKVLPHHILVHDPAGLADPPTFTQAGGKFGSQWLKAAR